MREIRRAKINSMKGFVYENQKKERRRILIDNFKVQEEGNIAGTIKYKLLK